ncbi:MAG: UvrD-helicase domain-containing protein, partial [Treponema sp.]|nr:UvrD-helicase domain-containing protein [Treponema sp.]
MKVIADLHIHSRFSRATSERLTPSCLDRWARIKGIQLLGTGDCTHLEWLKILRDELDDAEPGFYTLKEKVRDAFDGGQALSEELPNPNIDQAVRFVLTGEISTIYKQGEKTRKVHHVVILPDFRAAAAFQLSLEKIGNIRSDGRPILGIDSGSLLAMLLDSDENSMLIPAHIWTPWFSALGAKSGFDSIEECYGDMSQYIFSVETGLSSNPPMNWALKSLDKFSIVSSSDAHSPDKIGREATIFDMEMSYGSFYFSFIMNEFLRRNMPDSIKKHPPGILGTIEFFPQEGKYHYEGHRNCRVCMGPQESSDRDHVCPVCGKKLTPGVMGRVQELADRPVDENAKFVENTGPNCRPYYSLIPLRELLAELYGTGAASKKVESAYRTLIENAGPEFSILMDMAPADIEKLSPVKDLGQAIERMRSGEVFISPGYDGEYGVIRTFSPGEPKQADTGLFGESFDYNDYDSRVLSLAEKPAKYGALKKKAASGQSVNAAAVFAPDAGQKKIIDSKEKLCLIIAGPGTGKTAVLAAKIASLIREGADPASILALSFTVKAAGELRSRVLRLLQDHPVNGSFCKTAPVVLTFHSLCASILREQYEAAGLPIDFKILGEDERKDLLDAICGAKPKPALSSVKLGEYIEERKRYLLLPREKAADLARVLPAPLHNLLDRIPDNSSGAENESRMETLYSEYRNLLRSRGLVDYDGLIAGTVRLLSIREDLLGLYRQRFRFIFVDEYQDLNFAQYVLVRLLAPSEKDSFLWVIGDPNQAIYGFRGSDKAFIDRFTLDYPQAHKFELLKSFRCSQPIIEAAGRLANTRLEGVNAADAGSTVSLYRREYSTEKSEAEGIARTIASLAGGTSFFAVDSGTAEGEGEDNFSLQECA